MSSSNSRPGQPFTPPTQTPVPLPRFPGFTRGPSSASTATPRRDAPASLPGAPNLSRPNSSSASSPGSQVKSSRKNASGVAVMLRSPAMPDQYVTVEEPEDDVYDADELALSDADPRPKRKVSRPPHAPPEKRQGKPALGRPPIPKTITPVPLPKTAASPAGPSTPQQRSRATTPGSKTGNLGRPKGWKPGMSYADVRAFGPEVAARNAGMDPTKLHERARKQRAAAPLPGTQTIRKKRGKPAKEASPSPRAIYEGRGAMFVPFLCEWRGCKAELHNLETLGRHVHVVHCGKEATACLWRRCADERPPFGNPEALGEHVDKAHLIPYAWHIGDGPKVSLPGTPAGPDEELPGYLFDETGRQVTPSVRDQQVEDHATRRARKQMLNAFMREAMEAMPYEVESGDEGEAAVPALSVVFSR